MISQKHLVRLEEEIEGKRFGLLVDADSPVTHIKQAICDFIADPSLSISEIEGKAYNFISHPGLIASHAKQALCSFLSHVSKVEESALAAMEADRKSKEQEKTDQPTEVLDGQANQ